MNVPVFNFGIVFLGKLRERHKGLNAGNFGMARRMFSDTWVHPSLQDLSAALSNLVKVPNDAELWPDTSDMPILRDDSKAAAEILQLKQASIVALVNAGFDPATAQNLIDRELARGLTGDEETKARALRELRDREEYEQLIGQGERVPARLLAKFGPPADKMIRDGQAQRK